IAYSTYLGGSDIDRAFAVAVDPSGNAYIAGQTASANFPTANALQPTIGGGTDLFVTKLDPDGASLVYSTFLGGSASDLNWGGLHVAAAGTVYLAGSTDSVNFPVVDAIQPVKNSGRDVFVTVIAPDGAALSFSTFLGGNANEDGYGVAVDAAGSIYVT